MSTITPIPRLPAADTILIAGAGIIGLSLALEFHARGHRVTVVEVRQAMRGASSAAAGMLAADDPHNPAALHSFSRHSLALYPEYLERISTLSGQPVPFQTDTVVQYHPAGPATRLAERSLDPRQLAIALLAAVRAQPRVTLLEDTGHYDTVETAGSVDIHLRNGGLLTADALIQTQGAWFPGAASPQISTPAYTPEEISKSIVTPRKGQMLRVALPHSLPLREVHRREDVYIVPRTLGTNAGTALIGATVEDAGFDTTTHPHDLAGLRARAAELLPVFADEQATPTLEAWAGLRPTTPDGLPLLGALTARQFAATGHFRNGILLAPATAVSVADLVEDCAPRIDLSGFAPARFRPAKTITDHLP